jgi:AcrR family transcriptional regulator
VPPAANAAQAEPTAAVDGRRARGRRTRASILEAAAAIASVEGLEGLTIGRLAGELQMSKSGLFAHFGSKEELQLATIDAAREIFAEHVITPALEAERGLPRLRALIERHLAYLRAEVFAGGCFFETVRSEFDSREPGPVRDAIERDLAEWHTLMLRAVRSAQKAGHLREDVDAEQLLFEVDALATAASLRHQLNGDAGLYDRAAAAIDARLRAASA